MHNEFEKLFDKVMDYECENMEPKAVIPFFQELIDSGLAWKLSSDYTQQATVLINQGYCRLKNNN